MPGQPPPRSSGVKEVAARAGVSLGTVSNVLNRPTRVSAATRERVERAMVELGFVRNESARQLRAGRSSSIAYVMLDATNPFFTDVAQGVEDTAAPHDLSVFLCNSDNRADRELAYLTRLEQQRVQGVLVTPIDPDHPSLDEVADRGTPIVLVDRVRTNPTRCSVAVDDVLGGRIALEHLLDRGHERIAFVGGPLSVGQVHDRLAGARQALASLGRDPDSLLVTTTQALTVAEGRNAGERLLGMPRGKRPTAAFCANDLLALGLLQHCVTSGLARPPRPRHRRLRRHRVRLGRRGAPDLGAPAPATARQHGDRAARGRGDQPRPRAPPGGLHPGAGGPGLDPRPGLSRPGTGGLPAGGGTPGSGRMGP